MQHEGHRKRLRTRFETAGLEAFAPHEVLQFLLSFAIPRRDTNPIAHALLQRFGSLHAVLQATPDELQTIDGIGDNAASLIALMLPLFRAYRKSVQEDSPLLSSPTAAARYCEALFEGEKYEKFYVICLDARMKRLSAAQIGSGDTTQVRVYTRHIVSVATQSGACGLILAHNHPGGSAAPSEADVSLTLELHETLRRIGITLFDHIISAENESFSFLLSGLMPDASGNASPLTAGQNTILYHY